MPCRRAIALACAALLLPAAAGAVDWTGGAPIFAYPGGEVANALDCAGLNNAGTRCDTLYFWGYGGNWGGVLPVAGDTVKIVSADTILVMQWDSPIRGGAKAASTSTVYSSVEQGGGGSLYIDIGNTLHTVNAGIDRLSLAGQLAIDGTGLINYLDNPIGNNGSGIAVIRGSGATTVLHGSNFQIADSQRVTLTGSIVGSGTNFTLYDDAVLTTTASIIGELKISNYGSSKGGSDFSAERRYVNLGSLDVGTASGSRPRIQIDTLFYNQGFVDIGADGLLYSMAGGVHSSSAGFKGGATSQMQFAGYHAFAAGSSVSTQGAVVLGGPDVSISPYAPYLPGLGNYNDVAGSFSAGSTQVLNSTLFQGDVSPGALSASAAVVFNGTGKTTLPSATLSGGRLWGTAAVDVSGPLIIRGTSAVGTQAGVRALGGISFDGAGTKVIGNWNGLAARLENTGSATLQGGDLNFGYRATFANLAGASFDVQGDLNLVGNIDGTGKPASLFDNAGSFVKSAGAGTSTVTTVFDNRGSAAANSGTLRLLGGGTHTGNFSAASLLDLGGNHVFAGNSTLSGGVGLYGSTSLTIAAGASLTNRSTRLSPSGPAGAVTITNFGNFDSPAFLGADALINHGNLSVGSFVNVGDLTNAAGTINTGASTNSNIVRFVNQARVGNAGTIYVGSFNNSPGAMLTNTGSLYLGTSGTSDSNNLGTITNTGTLTMNGRDLYAGQIQNDGRIVNQGGGTFWVGTGDVVAGAGSLQQYAGVTRVDGSLSQAGGILIGDGGTLAGLGRVTGNVQVTAGGQILPGNSPGTLTIVGNLDISRLDFEPQTPQIVFEVVDARLYDRLLVSGQANIGYSSKLLVQWQGSTVPDLDDRFDLLQAGGGVRSDLAFDVSGLDASWGAQTNAGSGNGVSISFSNSAAYQIQSAGPDVSSNTGTLRIGVADYAYNLSNQNGFFGNYGVIENAGRFYNRNASSPQSGGSPGFLINGAGATLANTSTGYLQNRGSMVNQGGTLDNAGTFVNFADGTLTSGNGYDGIVRSQFVNRAGGNVSNQGRMVNHIDSTLTNQGSLTNGGALENNGLIQNDGGRLYVTAAGTVSGTGAILQGQGAPNFLFGNLQYAMLRPNGGALTVDGSVSTGFVGLVGGALDGAGTLRAQGLNVVFQQWLSHGVAVDGVTIRPGHGSGGQLSIDGDFSSTGFYTSTLVIDLGGGGTSGKLAVTGQLAYYGDLTFNLVGGYLPQVGDSFSFLTAAGGSFGFGSVLLQSVAADGSITPLAGPYWLGLGPNDPRGYLMFSVDGQTEYAIWNLDGSNATLTFSDTLAVPVDEPSRAGLLVAGLLLITYKASRPGRLARCRGGAA